MLAANRQDTRKRVEIITNARLPAYGEGPVPEHGNKWPRATPWQDCGDCLFRMVLGVPDGMSFGEARKVVGF